MNAAHAPTVTIDLAERVTLVSHFLDAKGLKCPLPVLRAKKAMRALASGEILVIEATDPAAPDDFRAFCETTGHELLATEQAGGAFVFHIKRAG